MRAAVLFALFLLFAADARAITPQSRHPYRSHWKHATYGKRAVAKVGAGAAFAQVRHHPRQYGGGTAGFGKRVGAGFATHAVKTTVEHAVAAPLHEKLHYEKSRKRGFGPRLRHALVSTVVTRNTRTGKHTPAAGRISGHAAAGAVSQGLLSAGSGASTAGVGLAADAGANVAREFWPRHHHHRRHRG
jgi:hypothetical protein